MKSIIEAKRVRCQLSLSLLSLSHNKCLIESIVYEISFWYFHSLTHHIASCLTSQLNYCEWLAFHIHEFNWHPNELFCLLFCSNCCMFHIHHPYHNHIVSFSFHTTKAIIIIIIIEIMSLQLTQSLNLFWFIENIKTRMKVIFFYNANKTKMSDIRRLWKMIELRVEIRCQFLDSSDMPQERIESRHHHHRRCVGQKRSETRFEFDINFLLKINNRPTNWLGIELLFSQRRAFLMSLLSDSFLCKAKNKFEISVMNHCVKIIHQRRVFEAFEVRRYQFHRQFGNVKLLKIGNWKSEKVFFIPFWLGRISYRLKIEEWNSCCVMRRDWDCVWRVKSSRASPVKCGVFIWRYEELIAYQFCLLPFSKKINKECRLKIFPFQRNSSLLNDRYQLA